MAVGFAACRRHRIEATCMPGMAARKARKRERTAAECAKAQHRLERILRAAWVEAARGPKERAYSPLVETDQER